MPSPTTAAGGLEITWLGQAGFALRAGRVTVLVDPFLTDVPGRSVPPPVEASTFTDVDVVLCTHEHVDHLDGPTVAAVAKASEAAVVVVPEPVVGLAHDLGIDHGRVRGARDGQRVDGLPPGVVVTALPAEHGVHVEDAYGFGRAHDGAPARYLGYVIELGGVRVVHAGDTLWWDGMEDALRTHDVHVALLPVNGRDRAREEQDLVGNMDAREAALVASRGGVDLLVPMHWDVFAGNRGFPEQVVTAVVALDLDVTVLVPRRMRPFRYVPR